MTDPNNDQAYNDLVDEFATRTLHDENASIADKNLAQLALNRSNDVESFNSALKEEVNRHSGMNKLLEKIKD